MTIGDRVRIVSCESTRMIFGISEEMIEHVGDETTIVDLYDGGGELEIHLDSVPGVWSQADLGPIEDEEVKFNPLPYIKGSVVTKVIGRP